MRKRFKVFLVFVFILLTSFLVSSKFKSNQISAQESGWSSDPSINTPIAVETQRHFFPKPVALNNSEIIVVWEDYQVGRIHAQKLKADGLIAWDNYLTFGYRRSLSDRIQAVYDGTNGVYVIWTEERNRITDIYITRIGSNGEYLLSQEGITISSINNCEHTYEPDMKVDSHGNAIIAWTCAYSSANSDIFVQKIDKQGNLLFGAGGIRASFSLQRARYPLADVNANNEIFVAWQDYDSRELGVQKFDQDGNKLWGEGIIIAKLYSLSGMSSFRYRHHDMISANNGGIYLSYNLEGDEVNIQEAYAQHLTAEGNKAWGEKGVFLEKSILLPSIVNGKNNELFLAWVISKNIHGENSVLLQILNDSGEFTWSEPIRLYNKDQSLPTSTYAIPDGSGGVIVEWVDYTDPLNPVSDEKDIFAQRVDSLGNKLWGENSIYISNAPKSQSSAFLALNQDFIVAVWSDSRNNNLDIYAQRVNLDGTLGNASPPTSTPTPTFTPTPTPVLCVLQNFGDSNGNPLRQDDEEWAGTPYGGIYINLKTGKSVTYNPLHPDIDVVFVPFKWTANNDIANYGCNLSSYTMILNYAAQRQKLPFSSYTPPMLNLWLQINEGYASGTPIYIDGKPAYVENAYIRPEKVIQFAKDKHIYLEDENPIFEDFTSNLNSFFCYNSNPAKIHVDNGTSDGHFVAGSGEAYFNGIKTFRMHDPLEDTPLPLLQKYTRPLRDVVFFDTLALPVWIPRIIWYLHSPAELLVTDPLGKKTGLDPTSGDSYSEIPQSVYYEDSVSSQTGQPNNKVKILSIKNPAEGEYKVEVIGTGNGSYALDFAISDKNANVDTEYIYSETKKDLTDNYKLDYSEDASDVKMILQTPINIRPFGRFNIINPNSNGVVPIAILTTENFDAKDVDPDSVTFGPDGAPAIKILHFLKDFDKDGDEDLILYFRARLTGISENDEQACISGKTESGMDIEGCDSIKTINPKSILQKIKEKFIN